MQLDACGFDRDAWALRDAVSFLEMVAWWWDAALEGVDAPSIAAAAAESSAAAGRLAASVREQGTDTPALWDAVHDTSHAMFDVSRTLSASGLGTAPGTGRVVQVNTSGGGVPKLPVARADVGWRGLAGDRQQDRKHHGRPFQALCLWADEVIDELAALGHPIGRGSAGENITIAGIRWADLRPGSLVQLGDVVAEISFPATPCAKQRRWFSDGDFGHIDVDTNPQWVRWYAWVRQPGTVATGDTVLVQPASG